MTEASFDPEQQRETLDAEQHRIAQQLDEVASDIGALESESSAQMADVAQNTGEQDEQRELAAALRRQLDEIEIALTRLDDGTYGTCEQCGAAIPDERLEAHPAARFCVQHAV